MALEELISIDLQKKDVASREIYSYFHKKYFLGTLGLMQSICIASRQVSNIRLPLSMLVISPSGQMKSQVTRAITEIFPENTVMIPSRFTPYGMSHEFGAEKLNNRTWICNDMIRTFDGLAPIKISELVGWLAEIISEGKSGSSTARSSEMEANMNLIGNIALISYRQVERKFISSTLNERITQFGFFVPKQKIRERADMKKNHPPIKFHLLPSEVTVTKSQKKKIYEYADRLQVIADYEKNSLRPDEMVTAFLAGHAKLNNRNRIERRDFWLLEQMFPHFKKII